MNLKPLPFSLSRPSGYSLLPILRPTMRLLFSIMFAVFTFSALAAPVVREEYEHLPSQQLTLISLCSLTRHWKLADA